MGSEAIYTPVQYQIINQVYRAIEILGGNPDILSIIGSWGDTLDDEEVLQCLQSWNETGESFDRILFHVDDTPQDRRKRFRVIESSSCSGK